MEFDKLDNTVRQSVCEALPALARIAGRDTRDKAVAAWGMCLQLNGFASPADLPPREMNGLAIPEPVYANGVAEAAYAAAAILVGSDGFDYPVNLDNLLASALCHGMGRAYTCNRKLVAKWQENPAAEGNPTFQYPMYSAYMAKRAGLPDDVVHCCWTHPHPAAGYGNPKWKRSFNANLLCTVINDFVRQRVLGNIRDNTFFAHREA